MPLELPWFQQFSQMTEISPHHYIVVEGPIGVGKTSLVKRIAHYLGNDVLLECPEENPFLKRFYSHGRVAALPTQLFFLLQRSRQLETLRPDDLFRPCVVSDFMLEKDRLFAEVTLDSDELALYRQIYERVELDAPEPDLIVYLQAPVDVLMARIKRRGKPEERYLSEEYLNRLSDAYTRFFCHYDRSPLLIINAAEINPVDQDEDFELLMQQILRHKSGRAFYNPAPSLL